MPFNLYKSSAGSGKTYTLVKEYLKIILINPKKIKNILAITFTNKVAIEMKERIILKLKELSENKDEILLNQIQKETNNKNIKNNISIALKMILHNYSDFHIMTIDSFITKIIKSFSLELDLPLNFNVSLDLNKIIDYSINDFFETIGTDKYIDNVIFNFIFNKIEESGNWNIEEILLNNTMQLLKEKNIDILSNKNINYFKYIQELKNNILNIKNDIIKISNNLYNKVDISLIKNKTKSPFEHFNKLKKFNKKIVFNALEKFLTKDIELKNEDENLLEFINKEKNKVIELAISYLSLILINENIYTIAIFDKINNSINSYKKEHNQIPLNDFNKLVYKIILKEGVPFLYWKIGEKLNHYLIDEFQDTSDIQWKNLLPLIENSLANNFFNMVVGDSKQSIYRWRGGNIDIMEQYVDNDLKNFVKTIILDTNYRSAKNIIEFNNIFFTNILDEYAKNYKELYSQKNVEQKKAKKFDGYVQVNSITENKDKIFKEYVLNNLLKEIKHNLSLNYKLKDMAIIVRTNKDGIEISDFLFQNNIDIISPESLLLNKNKTIRFIMSILNYLVSADNFNLFELENLNVCSKNKLEEFYLNSGNFFHKNLYELIEDIILFFDLNNKKEDIGFIQSLLELVFDYQKDNNKDLDSFLNWFEENSDKIKLISPENQNALTIITIHKVKGLEFPIVFLPFTNWAANLIKKGNKKENVWAESQIDKEKYFINISAKENKYTYFQKKFEEENIKTILDNINLLYVALTRPTEKLYIFIKETDSEKELTVSNIINKVLKTKKILKYSELEDLYFLGDKNFKKISKSKINENSIKINNIISSIWRNKISIRRNSDKFTEILNTETADKIKWGNLVHKILSKINSIDDIDNVIDFIINSGEIDLTEKTNLFDEIMKIMNLEHNGIKIKSFFDKNIKSKNECSLMYQGNEYRPDRIVFYENKTIVIDYKTGIKSDEHIKQINLYAEILKKMKFPEINQYLIYIDQQEVISSKII